MERNPVQSSNLSSVGYDANNMIIEIEFNNGGVYQYFGVPEHIFNELMSAGSKGVYFDQNIKKAGYTFNKIG